MKKKNATWLGKTLPEAMKGKIAAGRTKFAAGNEPEALRAEINALAIKRDLYRCSRCGRSGLLGKSLSIEVLDDKQSHLDLSNLITVCKDCKIKLFADIA